MCPPTHRDDEEPLARFLDRPRRVLWVADGPDVPAMLALMRFAGFQVRFATTGEEALASALIFHPDIVFIDVTLPNVNGWEIAARLRGEVWGPLAVVVAMDWRREAGARDAYMSAGFDFHIAVPIQSVFDLLGRLTVLSLSRQPKNLCRCLEEASSR